jgi:hypothetical protein
MRKIIIILIGIILAANTDVFSQGETLETVYVVGYVRGPSSDGATGDDAIFLYYQIYNSNNNNNNNNNNSNDDGDNDDNYGSTTNNPDPVDCAGVPYGSAFDSPCGCIGGTTGITECVQCDHQPFNPGNVGITKVSPHSSNLLSAYSSDYGKTDVETDLVDLNIGACSENGQWYAVLTGITGKYSKQTQLPYGVSEVTGPGGNTTEYNFCKQVEDLKRFGLGSGVEWYMISAVEAHEDVHVSRLQPALEELAYSIEAEVEALSVPNSGQTEAEAIEQIKALTGFYSARRNAFTAWDSKYVTSILFDDIPGGLTEHAESTIAYPMATSICESAALANWPYCYHCY